MASDFQLILRWQNMQGVSKILPFFKAYKWLQLIWKYTNLFFVHSILLNLVQFYCLHVYEVLTLRRRKEIRNELICLWHFWEKKCWPKQRNTPIQMGIWQQGNYMTTQKLRIDKIFRDAINYLASTHVKNITMQLTKERRVLILF